MVAENHKRMPITQHLSAPLLNPFSKPARVSFGMTVEISKSATALKTAQCGKPKMGAIIFKMNKHKTVHRILRRLDCEGMIQEILSPLRTTSARKNPTRPTAAAKTPPAIAPKIPNQEYPATTKQILSRAEAPEKTRMRLEQP
jgi:hypothetical protein